MGGRREQEGSGGDGKWAWNNGGGQAGLPLVRATSWRRGVKHGGSGDGGCTCRWGGGADGGRRCDRRVMRRWVCHRAGLSYHRADARIFFQQSNSSVGNSS